MSSHDLFINIGEIIFVWLLILAFVLSEIANTANSEHEAMELQALDYYSILQHLPTLPRQE